MTTDVDLCDAVIATIGYEHRVPARSVSVAVEDGYVTLTGAVGSSDVRAAAENAAHSVRGVRGVHCEITLRLTDIDVVAPN